MGLGPVWVLIQYAALNPLQIVIYDYETDIM
jgi:hypothetical protein